MMKKNLFYISRISLIFLFTLTASACFHGFRYVERPMPQPTDEIYEQGNIYNQTSTEQPVSYQEFYDELSPFGNWIDYPSYGYVWVPRVSVDFHPYATNGHWVMTNFGWTWVSDFRWGWAAFHYGRWAYEPFYGWLWVPGHEWGPAWVDWREDNDYFGWAPLGPFVNISISVSCPFDHYRFVPRRYFTHRQLHNYYADRHNNITIINHTTVINETHVVNKKKYYYGPRRENVEKAVGQKINPAEVYDNPKPDADIVDNNRVKVYRPRMDNATPNMPKPAPRKVVTTSDLQPIPSDRRLTPSVTRETHQNTDGTSRENREGVAPAKEKQPRQRETRQEKPNVQEKSVPINEPRREEVPQDKPNVKPSVPKYEPRREEIPQEKPNVQPKPVPKYEPRRDEREPRQREMPQEKPEVKPRPVPKNEPRREEPNQNKPTKIPPKIEPTRRDNPVPIKEKESVPPKKKSKDDNN